MPLFVVRPEYRDHGVAAGLIAKALDDIRASGKKVTVICPIVFVLRRLARSG